MISMCQVTEPEVNNYLNVYVFDVWTFIQTAYIVGEKVKLLQWYLWFCIFVHFIFISLPFFCFLQLSSFFFLFTQSILLSPVLIVCYLLIHVST